jgi:hypothetical protein
MSSALNTLAVMALSDRNLVTARGYLEESAEIDRRIGHITDIATGEMNLGLLTIALGDHEAADGHLAEAARLTRQTGERVGPVYILLGYALLTSDRGQPLKAATLHAAADAAIKRLELTFEPLEAGMRAQDHQHLRSSLGDRAFEAAYQEGQGLSLSAALTMASETDPSRWAVPEEASGRASAGAKDEGRPSPPSTV